jgi:hypothetical protein
VRALLPIGADGYGRHDETALTWAWRFREHLSIVVARPLALLRDVEPETWLA